MALTAALALSVFGEPPQFRAEKVIPSGGNLPSPLAPGMLVSIYGSHLGPQNKCEGQPDLTKFETPNPGTRSRAHYAAFAYPRELCGVEVLVGGRSAGLLYVQARQINFKVPPDVSLDTVHHLVVRYHGLPSRPVRVKLSLDTLVIVQSEVLYVGMPIWLRVHSDHDLWSPLSYAFAPGRLARCDDLEIRLDGAPVPRLRLGFRPGPLRAPGNLCGHGVPVQTGQIPVHLEYRLSKPGDYQVRYTRFARPVRLAEDRDANEIIERSAWTRIRVLPAPPGYRANWLWRQVATAPNDRDLIVRRFLPSILGYGDRESLEIAIRYLSHPDEIVRHRARDGIAAYYGAAMLADAVGKAKFK